jgi:hypothetical protein
MEKWKGQHPMTRYWLHLRCKFEVTLQDGEPFPVTKEDFITLLEAQDLEKYSGDVINIHMELKPLTDAEEGLQT